MPARSRRLSGLLATTAITAALVFGGGAALADTIQTNGRITAVTLFPEGAAVTRRVEVTLPAGTHDLVLSGFSPATDADSLRITASGASVAAVNLSTGRLPVTDDTPAPAVAEAEAEVTRLEAALRARDAEIARLRLPAEAAKTRIAVLQGLGQTSSARAASLQSPAAASAEDIRALARALGDEALLALEAAAEAEAAAREQEVARTEDQKALDAARQTLESLRASDAEGAVLTLAVQAAEAGPAVVEIVSEAPDAGWGPVYDLRLSRGAQPALVVARGAVLHQASGEDWQDVTLTLSTARPGGQTAPGPLWPELVQVVDKDTLPPPYPMPEMAMAPAPAAMDSASRSFAEPVAVAPEMQGATLTYRFDHPVTIRSGVDALRLAMGDVTVTPEVRAVAVPRRDDSAYLVADLRNTSDEVLLPGPARFYADGALTGAGELPLIAAGDRAEVGFGPIDGLRVTREVPDRSEGARGLLSSATERREIAQLRVENLTQEAWPLRIIDQVPYSEQEELTIDWTASLAPTAIDKDGARGLLEWDVELAPGATQEITLDTRLRWPEGKLLQ